LEQQTGFAAPHSGEWLGLHGIRVQSCSRVPRGVGHGK
jgi:hypothetical protein